MKHLIIVGVAFLMPIILTNVTMAQEAAKVDSVKALTEVTVTGRKQLIKHESDRVVYDLQADPESKSSTVLEMMRKIPYLTVDAADNLLMKGNTSYKILINGKPSGMMDMNAREFLRSMPAASIERIEVITTPSSKYDAEGLGGIINIITVKKISDGYNGTLNINERFPAGGISNGVSLAIKSGRTGINLFGGAGINRSPVREDSNERTIYSVAASHLAQEGTRKSDSRNGHLGLEISYETDSLHLISTQFNLYSNYNRGTRDQHSSWYNIHELLLGYTIENRNRTSDNGWDAALNYQLGFKADKNRLLTFSYRYMNSGNDQEDRLAISNRFNYNTPDYSQANESNFSEQTLQADYIHPAGKTTIEAGLKSIFRNSSSDFLYYSFNDNSGLFEPDAGKADHYKNMQNIYSFYNTYSYNLKTWHFKGGFRVEQTIVSAHFISSASEAAQNYFNVVPAVSVNKNLSGSASMNFGFTQRIKRPGIKRLNPFIDRSTPFLETSGNPDLKPSLITDMQLGYSLSGKASFNTSLSYSYARRMDFSVTTFDPATNITHIIYQNSGNAFKLGAYAGIDLPITKRWNMALKANIDYYRIGGVSGKEDSSISMQYKTFSVSTGYNTASGWKFNAGIYFNGRNPFGLQTTSNAYSTSTFSITKDMVKKKISCSVSANNPFIRYRYNRAETKTLSFIENSVSKDFFRQYKFSLNYRFGKLKEAIRKNQRGIKNDDVSG